MPVPIALRLYLPQSWTGDPQRPQRAGAPEALQAERSKPEIALAELRCILEAGVRFGVVLADAGYGISAAFRRALSALGLLWAVGIPRIRKVFHVDVELIWPTAGRGRKRQTAIPSSEAIAAEDTLADAPWRAIAWRRGTKGPLKAEFVAMRVRVTDGPAVRMHKRVNQSTFPLKRSGSWASGRRLASGSTIFPTCPLTRT